VGTAAIGCPVERSSTATELNCLAMPYRNLEETVLVDEDLKSWKH